MTNLVADTRGLQRGTPDLQSVGPIAFSPDGLLFVADNVAAAIVALQVDEPDASTAITAPVSIENLDGRLAAYLGCPVDDVQVRDMAVHPRSHRVYLSVMRGSGAAAVPLLLRLSDTGVISEVSLRDVPFAWTLIDDAPAADDPRTDVRLAQPYEEAEDLEIHGHHLRIRHEPLRTVTITDLAYVDGNLVVAGASNEEFASTLRLIPFPFTGQASSSSLEIFHVSHGRYETASPLRTFVPYAGNTSVLASYTCTPVVHFPLADLKPGTQAKGRTVADLGAMNTPIDIVSYTQGGEEYLLVSNVNHPLLKFASRDVDQQPALTQPKDPVGVPREALPQQGVTRMANLNGTHVLMLQHDEAGLHLRPYSTDSL